MIINLNQKEEKISVGDIIVDELDNTYFIIKTGGAFPIKVVDIQSGEEANGYTDIKYLNEKRSIFADKCNIVRIIKNKDIVLSQVGK